MCEVLGHKDIKTTLLRQFENEYKIYVKDIEKRLDEPRSFY